MHRRLFEPEHDQFRASFRRFVEERMVPRAAEWDAAGLVDPEIFKEAGSLGFLGLSIPEELGGGGSDDFRFNQIIGEECHRVGLNGPALGFALHNDMCLPYLVRYTNPEQAARWLPGVASGETILAVAMTEPSTGSDLAAVSTTARREGDTFVLNGAKTFITNGINADLAVVAARTSDEPGHRGISLLVVEAGTPGFERGRNLEKLGLHAQDTAELFFSDCVVPADHLLGPEGGGFKLLMANLPTERLTIASGALAAARAAVEWTVEYVRDRTAFGAPIGSFQNTRFVLAELATEVEVGQAFVDDCVLAHNDGTLTAEEAAMAKWWCTELQGRATTRCLQLHGGTGYMADSAIGKAFVDARGTAIYGGTTEIMKEIIGRSLKLA